VSVFRVVSPGPYACYQDLGRPGRAHQGVPRSGAADRRALRLGNRLVGNSEGAAAVEALLGSIELETIDDAVAAVTGASCQVSAGSRLEGMNVALRLGAGERLRCATSTRGLRVYVSVRGGFAPPPVLGSRSYDELGRIGPPPLAAGDELEAGLNVTGPIWWEPAPVAAPAAEPTLRLRPGPRDDWATAEALTLLISSVWTVLPASNRTGLRLSGPVLTRRAGELPSEPTLPGAVQLPADGQPILLGPDSGTTGGYPVLAVVCEEDMDHAGQAAPGTGLRFRWR